MRLVKIGLANLDPTVGAIDSNAEKVTAVAAEMASARCGIGVFSEQVLSGYPSEDLVQWRGFVDRQWNALARFATATAGFDHPTVFALGLTVRDDGLVYNAVALVAEGRILGVVPKENLPTYEVFYEQRTFARGLPRRSGKLNGVPFGDLVFRLPFGVVATEVCEDLWAPDGPMLRRAASGAELVLNLSASPWRSGIVETRRELVATRAADHQVTLVYVNQFGGQDSLVFDGGGFVNQNGRMLLETERWREGVDYHVVDLARTTRLRAQNTTWRAGAQAYRRAHPPVECIEVTLAGLETTLAADLEELSYPRPREASFFLPGPAERAPATDHADDSWYRDLVAAMKTGLAGYFEKTGAFERLGIALSGGKDSALTLLIAWEYARERFRELPEERAREATKDFVQCFSMPSRFNSDTTRNISRQLCESLSVGFKEVPIQEAFERECEAAEAMLPEGAKLTDLTRQNIQARIRGQRMWNWANSAKGMWLQTGNMSEKAVGYTTVGGDLMGAYSLIGNLPKTIVIRLVAHFERRYRFPALSELLATEASAELREDQQDERDLMPFPVLDACFALFAGEKLMPRELYRAVRDQWSEAELREMRADYRPGMLKLWVKQFLRLFTGSIFKWVQAPQAVHLGNLDLDRERALQLPVVQSREWLDIDAIDDLPD